MLALMFAYVGPGAGLGMIGSLLAVLAAILIALLGVVLYPLMLLRNLFKRRSQSAPTSSTTATTESKS